MSTLFQELETKIIASYQTGVSAHQAEMLAGEFLGAMCRISDSLKHADLDARMRKSGLKALRASLYLNEVGKSDKKPTEGMLTATLDSMKEVISLQNALDEAEAEMKHLERMNNVFENGHIHYRTIAKGAFGV